MQLSAQILNIQFCWVKVNPDTVNEIYITFLSSNEILNKKHTLFFTVSHYGSIQTERILKLTGHKNKYTPTYGN
jgi:hypothetical protein